MIIYFLATLLIFYITVLVSLIIGLFRLKPGDNTTRPVVSIIVAARNEEGNIGACLSALTAQDYDRSRLEIIIVDDRSTDGTADIVAFDEFGVWVSLSTPTGFAPVQFWSSDVASQAITAYGEQAESRTSGSQSGAFLTTGPSSQQ